MSPNSYPAPCSQATGALWRRRRDRVHDAEPSPLTTFPHDAARLPACRDGRAQTCPCERAEEREAHRDVPSSGTDDQLSDSHGSDRTKAVHTLRSRCNLAGVSTMNRRLKVAARAGGVHRLDLDFAENLSKAPDRLVLAYVGDVGPREVAHARNEDRKCDAARLDRGVTGEASCDYPAVESINADIPSAGRPNGEVVTDMVHETGTDELFWCQPGQRGVGAVYPLPALFEVLELASNVAGGAQKDPVAGGRQLPNERFQGRLPEDGGLGVQHLSIGTARRCARHRLRGEGHRE